MSGIYRTYDLPYRRSQYLGPLGALPNRGGTEILVGTKQPHHPTSKILKETKCLGVFRSGSALLIQIEAKKNQYRQETIEALKKCKNIKNLNYKELFNDVYDELTDNLKEQQE